VRTSVLPDAPTIAESGLPGFDNPVWFGLFAPAGTPPAIVDKLNGKMNEILAVPAVKTSYAKLGFDTGGGSPAELAQRVDTEIKKWTALVREKNIHVEQ
jgi:tripartite-type tricarboxylate transporter receptor subunit TctC